MNNYEQIILQNSPHHRRYSVLNFVVFYTFLIIVVIFAVSSMSQNKFPNHSTPSFNTRALLNDENSLNLRSSQVEEEELENTYNNSIEDDLSNQTTGKDLSLLNKSSNNNLTENMNKSLDKDNEKELPSFFESIKSKLYKGKWTSAKNIVNFKNTEGSLEIRFYLEESASLKQPKISFKFTVRDGYYFGKYLDFDIIFQTNLNPPVNNNVIFNLRSALFELKGKEYFTDKSYYSKLLIK